MKISTERRILFALLISSLVPLLALGFLSAAAVGRMGEGLARQNAETRREQMRDLLLLRCEEVAQRVSAFLRGREADLRALSLVARTPQHFLAFYRNSTGPVWAEGGDGRTAREWIPIYREVCFLGPDGQEQIAVHPGAAAQRSTPEEFFARARSLPPGDIWATPTPAVGAQPLASFDGSLRLAMPARSPEGAFEGVVSLVVDPRQISEHLSQASEEGERMESAEMGRAALYFTEEGGVVFYPDLTQAFGPHQEAFALVQIPRAVQEIRSGGSGVTGPVESHGALHFLAYAPLLLDEGPRRDQRTIGGILLTEAVPAAELDSGPPGGVSLIRGTLVRIALLTLAATFCVALAGFLVARRMGRPWSRLREKVRGLSDAPQEDGRDEIDEIARSFDTLTSQVAVSAGQLRASEERLVQFVEMSPDGIAVVDAKGRLLHFNRALCQILRRTPGELSRLRVGSLYLRSADQQVLLASLREKGRLRNYEVDLTRGDGSSFRALLTLRLSTHGGEGEVVDAIVRDLSDFKEIQKRDREKTAALFHVYGELSQAHEALRRAYGEVEEEVQRKTEELRTAYDVLQTSDRVKTEFLMKMSHELRTPLNCIIGYSEAMREGLDGPVSEDQARSLDRIAHSGRRLLRMIENLLDLSRLEAGRMEILCDEMRLEEIVEDVIHQSRSLVGNRPLQLEAILERPLPTAWADPDRVRQVLFNLVGNALKFTRRGQVRITARSNGDGMIEVRVVDTGPGIPVEHMEQLFEKFFQAPGSDRSGAGLGLAICRDLVERMGGTIRVESEYGAGATFVFTLPAAASRSQLALPLGA